jgi:hypothetical protein
VPSPERSFYEFPPIQATKIIAIGMVKQENDAPNRVNTKDFDSMQAFPFGTRQLLSSGVKSGSRRVLFACREELIECVTDDLRFYFVMCMGKSLNNCGIHVEHGMEMFSGDRRCSNGF